MKVSNNVMQALDKTKDSDRSHPFFFYVFSAQHSLEWQPGQNHTAGYHSTQHGRDTRKWPSEQKLDVAEQNCQKV